MFNFLIVINQLNNVHKWSPDIRSLVFLQIDTLYNYV